jgi:mono/diheme cytochrome c family protein
MSFAAIHLNAKSRWPSLAACPVCEQLCFPLVLLRWIWWGFAAPRTATKPARPPLVSLRRATCDAMLPISERESSDMIRFAIVVAIIASSLAAAAAQSDEGPPRWAANIARKQQVIMHGVPRPYSGMRDPLPDTNAKLQRGQAVFDQHCAACHGWTGQGTGPEAFAQVPAPADLEWMAHTPKARSEPYMYWTVAEGGRSFESGMPAFKRTLSTRDIWSVIAYVRAGLPHRSP